jgi:hypothetical protein
MVTPPKIYNLAQTSANSDIELIYYHLRKSLKCFDQYLKYSADVFLVYLLMYYFNPTQGCCPGYKSSNYIRTFITANDQITDKTGWKSSLQLLMRSAFKNTIRFYFKCYLQEVNALVKVVSVYPSACYEP